MLKRKKVALICVQKQQKARFYLYSTTFSIQNHLKTTTTVYCGSSAKVHMQDSYRDVFSLLLKENQCKGDTSMLFAS